VASVLRPATASQFGPLKIHKNLCDLHDMKMAAFEAAKFNFLLYFQSDVRGGTRTNGGTGSGF